jgi:hypothetical protein
LLKKELSQNVNTDEEVDEEYLELLKILSSPKAG